MDEIKDIENVENNEIKNPAAAVEAIIFAAGYPMKYDKIAEVLSITPSEVKRHVSELAEKYNTEEHGIMILMFPETCQFCTKEQHLPFIKEALGIKRGGNLSASSMEVLAIVAYNQPVTRSFVDLVRGVDSNYAMNSLIDKALIECSGRLDAPGRPMLYSTTDKFLRVFGISSVNELPEIELLRASDEQMEIMAPGEEIVEEE
jgi:segregation and condensation protein B